MKMRPFSLRSTSTLSGASAADEQAQITKLLGDIAANINTVTKNREQLAAVRNFLASNPPADERPYAEQEWQQLADQTENVEMTAIEKARRTAQQLATYLMVASHIPSGVETKLRTKGDALLNQIDALQAGWHNFNWATATQSPESKNQIIQIIALLDQMSPLVGDWFTTIGASQVKQIGKFQAFFPSSGSGGSSGFNVVPVKGFKSDSSSDETSLSPAMVCRNLSPALQAWYAKQGVDCVSLPEEAVSAVALCAVTGKAFDVTGKDPERSAQGCVSLPGEGGEGGTSGGNHKEPGAGEEQVEEKSSSTPWIIGTLAVIAGIGWYATRKTKKTP